MKRWYVVQVYTGFEDVVKTDLEKRIADAPEATREFFGDVLVPSGETTFFWSDEEPKKEKIFPGYILVQMDMTSEAFRMVMSAPRVYKFLGGDSPVPLSNKEVERIFAQMSGKIAVAEREIPFAVGSEVTVATGPFSGFLGIVDRIDDEHKKLTVMVSIFGRLTPVELDFEQVKK